MYYLLLNAAETTTTSTKFFYENWIIVKPFIWLFSQCMNGIMFVLDKVGIYNIALCIVLFTILTKMLLLPMTIKQQKTMRIQSIMNPEIQALQKKYAGKTDTLSRQKMMEEQQAIQQKYGVSMFGGCLPTLIQMPILFALYPVIYRMEEYVKYLGTLESKLSMELIETVYQNVAAVLTESERRAEQGARLPLCVAGPAPDLSRRRPVPADQADDVPSADTEPERQPDGEFHEGHECHHAAHDRLLCHLLPRFLRSVLAGAVPGHDGPADPDQQSAG